MAKLLITGGAGFIGSHFIRYWLEEHPGDSITNLDALTYAASPESLRDIEDNPHYTFVHGNICDTDLVNQLVSDVEVIIHFAAETHNDRAITNLKPFIETNVRGTHVLLEAVKQKDIHFHHISTDEVFGHLELGSNKKFTENTPYYPRMPYAATKAASDHLVRSYYETHKLPITITNCSNNFGSYMNPEKFIPRMITNLIDGQPVKIYGDGKYVRDWLYVRDHARAIDAILQSGKTGETYLVGGMEKDVNNLEVAQMIVEYMFGPAAAKAPAGDPESRIKFVKDRPGHDRRYAVDWSKIQRELGWEPQHSFEEWLKTTVGWYKENESWWRPLKEESEKMYAQSGQ